jgi:hypothetical protein
MKEVGRELQVDVDARGQKKGRHRLVTTLAELQKPPPKDELSIGFVEALELLIGHSHLEARNRLLLNPSDEGNAWRVRGSLSGATGRSGFRDAATPGT